MHTITLAVRGFKGKLHTLKRTFKLNGTPGIRADFSQGRQGVFDPEITFSFFGQRNEIAGMVDFYLDDRPLATANISAVQNNFPFKLSELTGSTIYTADLVPGNHLRQ